MYNSHLNVPVLPGFSFTKKEKKTEQRQTAGVDAHQKTYDFTAALIVDKCADDIELSLNGCVQFCLAVFVSCMCEYGEQ